MEAGVRFACSPELSRHQQGADLPTKGGCWWLARARSLEAHHDYPRCPRAQAAFAPRDAVRPPGHASAALGGRNPTPDHGACRPAPIVAAQTARSEDVARPSLAEPQPHTRQKCGVAGASPRALAESGATSGIAGAPRRLSSKQAQLRCAVARTSSPSCSNSATSAREERHSGFVPLRMPTGTSPSPGKCNGWRQILREHRSSYCLG